MKRDGRMLFGIALAVVAVNLGSKAFWPEPSRSRPPAGAGAIPKLGAAQRAATLRFAPEVLPADRQLILATIASARPEARRLIEIVDGVTTVKVGASSPTAAGHAVLRPGRYELVLDLAQVSQSLGQRGVARLVLHELGHVVDHALVGPALATRLDAAIPRGWATSREASGSSATREERFAESFAKWAANDIGIDLYIGYAVPPPPLDWGAPLTSL